MSQLNLPGMKTSGEKLKRRGMHAAYFNEPEAWRVAAMIVISELTAACAQFTSDDVHAAVTARIGEPHHPNVWGALTRKAVNAGVMKRTGRIVPSTRSSRHSNMIPEYAA